jgi:hypothetical protein
MEGLGNAARFFAGPDTPKTGGYFQNTTLYNQNIIET